MHRATGAGVAANVAEGRIREMDDEYIQLLQNALGLMRSISMSERTELIQQRQHNDHLQALALAAHVAATQGDTNALRTAIDTAFCLGVRAGKQIACDYCGQ